MASSAPNRVIVGRAAAILTTAEVAGAKIDLNDAFKSEVSLQVDFTLGSLTNAIVRVYVSMDGVNFYQLQGASAAAPVAITYTASQLAAIAFDCIGWKFFRATIQGTGTVTSSSATLTYRYLRRGTQM